ncbi:DMT family transporter [Paenibacillus turpanensis]|uniref:DMT family transporter n=1 Tax=Paenibacillus turpanensis TaxID=2689078 RepID=UPI00140B24AE|nr:EamA family transporter [Paenibacillus turpanensis]
MKKTYALLALATISWGGAFLGGKISTQTLTPEAVAFFRFLVAALLLFPMLWLDRRRQGRKQATAGGDAGSTMSLARSKTFGDWLLLFALGATGMCLYNLCFFFATKHAAIVKSSLVIAVNAPMITVLSALFLKERLNASSLAGLIVALTGSVYVIVGGDLGKLSALRFEPVDLVLLGACVSWAVYSVLSKVAMRKFSPLEATAYGAGFGALLLLPFAWTTTTWQHIVTTGWDGWAGVLYVGVIVSVVSFLWWNSGIKEAGASKAAIFVNLMPLSAIAMAAVFLGETFTSAHLIGGMLIFSGIYLNIRKKRTQTRTKSLAG